MMSVEQLFEMLGKSQAGKGCFFNRDRDSVFELLNSLLINKERYGYMCCPCRLSANDYEKDKDIICPCIYRVSDVEEYGSCYCNLYVSEDWNNDKVSHKYVPERRPPEKMFC